MNLVQAVGQSLAPEENANPTVVSALIELGAMYAQLNPTPASTEPPLNFFLDTLWQAQDEAAIQKGTKELKDFFATASSPSLSLLKLETNLLKSIKPVQGLEEKHDPKFLSVLMEFGKAYADLNPALKITEQEQANLCLGKVLLTQHGPDQSRTIELEVNVDDPTRAFQYLVNFGQVIDSADLDSQELTKELLELASAYLNLNPLTIPTVEDNSFNFFLNTLWLSPNQVGIEQAVREFEAFLADFSSLADQIKMVDYISDVLEVSRSIATLREELRDPSRINDLVLSAILYPTFTSALHDVSTDALDSFFAQVWDAQDEADLNAAAENLKTLTASASSESPELPLASLLLGQIISSPLPETPPIPAPPQVPPALSRPIAALIAIVLAARIIDAGPTVSPRGDEVNPITRLPYQSDEEYELVQQLSPDEIEVLRQVTGEQLEELVRLARNRRWFTDDYLDFDPDHRVEMDEGHKRCIIGEVPRVDPFIRDPDNITKQAKDMIRANAYAQHITGSDFDFYALTPGGVGRQFDGRTPGTRTIWEVKAPRVDEAGNFLYSTLGSSPNSRALKALQRLEQQKNDQSRIAKECNFEYRYAVASRGLAKFLNDRWRTPTFAVQYSSYPYTPFP
jgi:hypothetical protein